MRQGYIRLWRKSLDSGLIRNHNVWIFWTWCLLKANYKPNHKQVVGFQEVILQPGDFIFGREKAAEETGLSEQNIRTCLTFLKKSKNLTIKTTNKFSIISIINWGSYQQDNNTSNQQTNQHLTSSQPASNHKQELKNLRIKEINNTPLTPHGDDRFEKFWEMYSKKTGRKNCERKWSKLKAVEKDLIFETLPAYIQSTPDPKFRKNPMSYLNGECWHDEIIGPRVPAPQPRVSDYSGDYSPEKMEL